MHRNQRVIRSKYRGSSRSMFNAWLSPKRLKSTLMRHSSIWAKPQSTTLTCSSASTTQEPIWSWARTKYRSQNKRWMDKIFQRTPSPQFSLTSKLKDSRSSTTATTRMNTSYSRCWSLPVIALHWSRMFAATSIKSCQLKNRHLKRWLNLRPITDSTQIWIVRWIASASFGDHWNYPTRICIFFCMGPTDKAENERSPPFPGTSAPAHRFIMNNPTPARPGSPPTRTRTHTHAYTRIHTHFFEWRAHWDW